VLKRILVAQITRLAERTTHKFDDLIVAMLSRTKKAFLVLVALYAGTRSLSLPASPALIFKHTLIAVLLLQVGFWASAGIRFWIGEIAARRVQDDHASATTLSVLGFIARIVLWAALVLVALDIRVTHDTPRRHLAAIPARIREIIEANGRARFDRSHVAAIDGAGVRIETAYYVQHRSTTVAAEVQEQILLALSAWLRERGIQTALPTRVAYVRDHRDRV
jgi:hypothetical protein